MGRLEFEVCKSVIGLFAIAATSFNKYAASQGVATSGSFTFPGAKYAYYRVYDYDPKWTAEEYFRAKAKQSGENQILCQKIVSCYEENKPDVALADCVKATYQKEGKELSSK